LRHKRTIKEQIISNRNTISNKQSKTDWKIAELVTNKVIEDISDIRDESDRDGMRIVLELKRGAEKR